MKKLMIAAAIVCAAVISQAATVNWTLSTGLKVQGPTSSTDGTFSGTQLASPAIMTITAYQFDTEGARDAAFSGAWEAYQGGTLATAADRVSPKATASGTTIAAGASGKIDVTDMVTGSKVPLWGLVVITLDQDGNGSDDWYIINTADSEITTQGKATSSSNMATANGNTGWTAVGGSPEPTPEPTSGLLLLLGVAGLALRRRRA